MSLVSHFGDIDQLNIGFDKKKDFKEQKPADLEAALQEAPALKTYFDSKPYGSAIL